MTIVEEQAAKVLPPIQGAIVALNCNTTPTVLDITSIPATPAMPGNMPDQKNPVSHYIRVSAQGGGIYFALGSNATTLASISATSYSTVSGNKVTVTNNETDYIADGAWKDVIVSPNGPPQTQNPPGSGSPARYIALVTASGSAAARLYQSGP